MQVCSFQGSPLLIHTHVILPQRRNVTGTPALQMSSTLTSPFSLNLKPLGMSKRSPVENENVRLEQPNFHRNSCYPGQSGFNEVSLNTRKLELVTNDTVYTLVLGKGNISGKSLYKNHHYFIITTLSLNMLILFYFLFQ